jgi:hypothetical protein
MVGGGTSDDAVVWEVDSGAGQVEKVTYKEDAAAELVDKENAEAEDVDMAWVAYPAAVQILEEVPLLRLRILTLADVAHACASHMVSQRNNIDFSHGKPAVWREGLLAAFGILAVWQEAPLAVCHPRNTHHTILLSA